MRKKDENMHNIILDIAREMISINGPNSINIRKIAEKAGIASGTVYNYFSNKDDILITLTEQYWNNTLSKMHKSLKSDIFYVQLEEIYNFLSKEIGKSAGMLMASLKNVEISGRERMKSMHSNLEKILIIKLNEDPSIGSDIWNENFTKEDYVSFIITNMMMYLQKKDKDINFFIEIIKRTLY